MNGIKQERDSECNSSQYEDQGKLPQTFTFVAVKEEIVSHHHHLYFHKSSTVQDVEKSIQIQNKQYRVQCQYSYRGK
jgi:hypothetical protein